MIVSYISGEYFFKAAQEAQLYSLNRIVQISTKEIMQELHDHTYRAATTLAVEGTIPKVFSSKNNNHDKLINALDDPFITGFVGAYIVELVKVRVYDLNLDFIAESNMGIHGLPKKLPDVLYQRGLNRKGAERAKSLDALWQHQDDAYYSVLVPLGGIFITGYLEITVNPINNLVKLSKKMDSPVSIRSGINPDIVYYQPQNLLTELLPVKYVLKTDQGTPAFLLTSYENIAHLSNEIKITVFNTIALFLGLVLIILFIAGSLFEKFLFYPLNAMLDQIRYITDGNTSHDLQVKGLAEIDLLANEFNKMANEISAREDELKHLSVIDELTKIPNRRKFNEVLNHEYLEACRTLKPLSIIMIDIDYFKNFNDTYGHLAGDDCLKRVAAALQQSICRPGDLIARYGGEEFIIILPDTPENGEHVVSQKIMREISRLNIPHSNSMVSKVVTVSIGGYTVIPSNQYEPAFIVSEADKSLYEAKQTGRNRFVLRSHPQ